MENRTRHNDIVAVIRDTNSLEMGITMDNQEFDAALLAMVPEAEIYFKDTGCLACDAMPGNQMCRVHRLEYLDWQIALLMAEREREELEQEKEKNIEFTNNESSRIRPRS